MTIPALEKKLRGKCLQGPADNKGMTQAVGKLSCLGREGMKEAPHCAAQPVVTAGNNDFGGPGMIFPEFSWEIF